MHTESNGYLLLALLCVAGVAWNNATMWEWMLDQAAWVAGGMVLMVPFMWLNRGKKYTVGYSAEYERLVRQRHEAAEQEINTSKPQ